jgi:hypothetical protein
MILLQCCIHSFFFFFISIINIGYGLDAGFGVGFTITANLFVKREKLMNVIMLPDRIRVLSLERFLVMCTFSFYDFTTNNLKTEVLQLINLSTSL